MTPGSGIADGAGGATGPFRATETHLSWLLMVGDRVLKSKKPVWTEFVDLTTLQARKHIAEREVELNRRLAPDVYLGVATLSGAAGLDEPVVVMRRMPDDRRLASLAQSGADLTAEVHELAVLIAAFHGRVDPVPVAEPAAEALRLWTDNTDQLRAHAGACVPEAQLTHIQALAERYLSGRGPLLAYRARSDRYRDGHGDLLADDVFCLPDGPRVLDCLEFDDRLRAGDVLADVAFLAMDLEHLGRLDLATQLLAEHRLLLQDDWPSSLADHWVAYRAQVRAKVACLRAAQGDSGAAGKAGRLLDLAEDRLLAAQPRVVLLGGTPGTGKSTLAAAIADRTGWAVLRSDVLRRGVVGDRGHGHADDLDQGAYTPELSRQVMHEMLRQAEQLIGAGRSVVLDASWADDRWRRAAADVARRTEADLIELRAVVPDDVADGRLRRRAALGLDASDATVETAGPLRSRFQRWPDAHLLDTRGPLPHLVDEALAAAPALARCP